ncbi:Inner membrane protein YbbJ [compost metagenome]
MITAHPHVFWLSLGGLLLAAEMLGGNGYLLWSGVAAVMTGLLVWLLPFGWEWQGALFAVLTLVAAWLWWRWLNRQVRSQKPADAALNQRGQQLVGKRYTLDTTLINGRGHVRIGDSSWPVIADEDLIAGTRVEVIAVEGITLRVKAS